jgi:hypothetical protein
MRKTSSIITIIFIVMSLNVFIYRAYGKCVEECIEKCDAIIDEKYSFGEGYMRDNKSAVDYLKMKNQEKVKCYGECKEECSQNIKKGTVDTSSELKKEPKEELKKEPKEA